MLATEIATNQLDSDTFLGRYWKAKTAGILTVICLITNIGLYLDKYPLFRSFYLVMTGRPDPYNAAIYWDAVRYQSADWLMEKLVVYPHYHVASMRFRLFLPVLYKLTHSFLFMYIIQVAVGMVVIYMATEVAYRTLKNRKLAFVFALGFVGIYAGAGFLLDMAAFGDSFAYAFMMGAIYFRKPLPIFLCVFLACWTDERAIFNMSLVILYHLLAPYREGQLTRTASVSDLWPTKQMTAILVAVVVHVAMRLWLMQHYHLTTPTGGNHVFFHVRTAMKTVGFRFWGGFEGFWLLLAAMLLVFWQRRRFWFVQLIALLTVITAFTCLLQADYVRTAAYGFPLLFVALIFTKEEVSQRDLFWILCGVALLSTFIYPEYY